MNGDSAGESEDSGGQEAGDELPETAEGDPEEGSDEEGNPASDEDLPDWMREDGDGGDSDPKEMDFEGEDAGNEPQSGQDEEQPGSEGEPVDDKEALERYIIEHRPVFEDMTLDFPSIIEQKRNAPNTTWRELANEMGMQSGQLTGMITKYKKRVKEQMAGSGVA